MLVSHCDSSTRMHPGVQHPNRHIIRCSRLKRGRCWGCRRGRDRQRVSQVVEPRVTERVVRRFGIAARVPAVCVEEQNENVASAARHRHPRVDEGRGERREVTRIGRNGLVEGLEVCATPCERAPPSESRSRAREAYAPS